MKIYKKYYIIFCFSLLGCTRNENEKTAAPIVYDESVAGQFDYARHLMSENNYLGAKTVLSEQIKLNPTLATLYEQRAICFSELTKHDSAIKDMDIAIRLNPQNISSLYLRGQLKYAANLYEASISDFDSVLLINPDFTEAYIGKGLSFIKIKMRKKACDCFAEAQAAGNDQAASFINEYCD